MVKILLLKTNCPQLGSEMKFLGRLLIKTERGFLVKPLAKLFDSLLSCAGLENSNPVHSPPAERKQYRMIVGKLMFIAAEWEIRRLVTCRGQNASADISWAPAIGH